MKRSVLPQQKELFAEPSSKSLALPMVNCLEVVRLLSKLLGEVVHARADDAADAEVCDDQDQR